MDSKVGCSWRQLELRGQQNATKSKQIYGTNSSHHTFVVEHENDGNSLLRFMKVVVPEYRELIPPPCLSTGFRPVQLRHNARIQGTESIGAAAPRQFRQNTETTMALNAFSDLEAIAEMGAGTDDTDPPLSEVTTRPASKLTGRGSPNPDNRFSSLAQPNAASATCDQRMRTTEQQNMAGGPSQLGQLSVEQQQRQRFGMNVVYRQQQPKQPMAPMGVAVNPSSSRLIMDSQPGLRHPSSSDVFNFVPDHSPFEDTPNFANISSTPYQSPTGGVHRRRGRGRRAGNFGDRQPSTSSSVEHEGTPESPSEFGTLRKPRGAGQRRARKPRKPANVSFEQKDGISRSPYQSSEAHAPIGQIPPLSAPPDTYISHQDQDEFRSKLMSGFEMGIMRESSTDDEEMDPPPPPKELMAISVTARKMAAPESDSGGCPVVVEKADGTDENGGGKKCVSPLAKCSVFSSHNQSSGGDQSTDPLQNAPLLQDIKLILQSAAPSSASSSPSFSQLNEQFDNRTQMAEVVKTELDVTQKQRTAAESAARAADPYDSEKKEAELDRLKQTKDVLVQNNLSFSSDRTTKETTAKKESIDSTGTAKRPALVLKIKKDGGASSAASTKHSSSSSSPSSTSSSTAVPPALAGPTLQQQHQLNEPVARLSSNAAPPSKYKQQRQQTKRPAGKDEAAATMSVPPAKKKQRKTTDAEGRSSSPSLVQQHRASTTSNSTSNSTTTKWAKEASMTIKSGSSATLKKEPTMPNVMSQITSPSFPNLKNFKIPKVVESADPPPTASCIPHLIPNKGGSAEHQTQCSQPGGSIGEKSSRNKFGPFKSSVEQRRPGGGPKQPTKGAGHPPTHFQYNDKFMGSGVGNSFQPHNLYNRQRPPKQQQMGGGGRHGGGNSELARKHRATPRPMLSSSAAGHRFTVQFQQHPRDAGPAHIQHHPLHPPLQHFPAQQHQFSSLGWQAVQPSVGEFFHQQQQHHSYLPQQQRIEWFGQPNDQAEQQRQPMGHSAAATTRSGQTRTADRQSGSCREEERTDNSPSAGNGLQIVDDE